MAVDGYDLDTMMLPPADADKVASWGPGHGHGCGARKPAMDAGVGVDREHLEGGFHGRDRLSLMRGVGGALFLVIDGHEGYGSAYRLAPRA